MLFRSEIGWALGAFFVLCGARARALRRLDKPGVILPVVFHAMPADDVRAILEWLAAHGFSFVSPDADGFAKAGRKAWITFDDAWKELADTLPVLEKMNVPATVFVAPGEIGRGCIWTNEVRGHVPEAERLRLYTLPAAERYEVIDRALRGTERPRRLMTAEEVKALAKHPCITIGNHSWTHPSCPHRPLEEILAEIDKTQKTLTEWCGYSPGYFAYPFGRGGSELDAAVRGRNLIPVYTRQGDLTPELTAFPRNVALEDFTLTENLGRILQAWIRVGTTR